jgi:UDP-GlcNAc3NAcA epimerase
MMDTALHFGAASDQNSSILQRLGLSKGAYVLATIHRAESTDDPHILRQILGGLAELHRSLPVVLPLHPRTRAVASKVPELQSLIEGLRTIDPVGYLDMLQLEKSAHAVVTDSGGVQKEAFFFKVPCITVRTETEWTELVTSGWNVLCAPSNAKELLPSLVSGCRRPAKYPALYGDGSASHKIAKQILSS